MDSKPYSSSEIHLVSCRPFDILAPREEDIDIKDIAHSLSLINRFGGQSPVPWSVANHSLHMYYEACDTNLSTNEIGWALLHDASEAYLGDIIRPIKKLPLFEEYGRLESQLTRLIARKFGLSEEMPESIKELDHRMLYTEKIHVLKSEADWGWTAEPLPFDPEDISRVYTDWKVVKQFYIRACQYMGWLEYERYN